MRAALLALLLAVSSPNGLVLRDMPEGWARADGVLDVTAACSQRWVGAPVPRATAWDAFQGGGLPAPTVWTYTYSLGSPGAAKEYVRRVRGPGRMFLVVVVGIDGAAVDRSGAGWPEVVGDVDGGAVHVAGHAGPGGSRRRWSGRTSCAASRGWSRGACRTQNAPHRQGGGRGELVPR